MIAPVKKLTVDEEADEIIRRLKAPPVSWRATTVKLSATRTIDPMIDLSTPQSEEEEKILEELYKSIAAEIDREILINYGQGKDRTRRHIRATT